MRKSLGLFGRLLFGEPEYLNIREKILCHFRPDIKTKYERLAKTFFRERRKNEEYENLYRARSEHYVKIDQPLVLISQVARSGGTFLQRLFDGHPECHIYPVELAMGIKPDIYEYKWPTLNLSDASETWLQSLIQVHVWRWLNNDFRYWPSSDESFSFIFLPLLCKKIFLMSLKDQGEINERAVFNCYMTGFFNAWIDNQNLYFPMKKRYIIAFAPNMGMDETNIERFFTVYPDGKYLSIIRDPWSWYTSASRYRPSVYNNPESIDMYWKRSSLASLSLKAKYNNRVILIRYEDLIQRTESTMRYLSGLLDIEFSPAMLIPTFNNQIIKANSSFQIMKNLSEETLDRYKEILTPDEKKQIDQRASNTYAEILRVVQAVNLL